ncbi:MAG TPA: hypothetical protein VK273_08205 [Gaiellaceae bacterium]|nr:hypothetical protein [Gaiellaceae bacterium]
MRKSVVRAVITAAAVATAVILFIAFVRLGGTDESAPETAGSGPQTTQSGVTEVTEPEQPPPQVKQIQVHNGEPVGGVTRLEYTSGQRIRFAVFSDIADKVHVHGFDIAKDVAANGSVRFDFEADIEGVYEVELEGAHVRIAELRIEP